MCTIKIHLAQFRVLVRWPGFNLQIKICLCFWFICPIYWLFFQDNKLALGNKATRQKCCGRNPGAVQPIQMFQEQLSGSAGAGLSRGVSTCRQQHCLDGSWLASKAARAGGGSDLSCILLRDRAEDRGCKYYWRTWHGPKAWLTGSNMKGMLCECYMGWALQTGLQVHFRKQGIWHHIPSLVQGLSLSWVLLWSGCSGSGLVLVLVYYNVYYTQGTASCIWGDC